MHLGFYGVGCPNPAIECFIAQVNKLLMHLSTASSLGTTMQASLDLLILELGMSSQPFYQDYKRNNKWVTHFWLKTIWEKASHLMINIELGPTSLKPPRGPNDFWLMQRISQLCIKEEIKRLNRIQLHQQVPFYLDVMGAGGRCLDKKYLRKQPPLKKWSKMIFPVERPPPKDFKLWRQILLQLRGGGRLHLGHYKCEGHKIWDWSYYLEKMSLFHWTGTNTADLYKPSTSRGLATRANAWGRTRINQHLDRVGDLCTVEAIGQYGNYRIVSHSNSPQQATIPTTFKEVIDSWNCNWLWKYLQWTGRGNWIVREIKDNTLIAVTDGSYMNKMYPSMNSCAFILECTKA
jgi:hypothetical protein